ncbi:hypothetical protein [Argonema antarcticum]|nr:hypothetical protein [Argonema antarcticum]
MQRLRLGLYKRSESGRAIASHQSVLIFDVLSTSDVPYGNGE